MDGGAIQSQKLLCSILFCKSSARLCSSAARSATFPHQVHDGTAQHFGQPFAIVEEHRLDGGILKSLGLLAPRRREPPPSQTGTLERFLDDGRLADAVLTLERHVEPVVVPVGDFRVEDRSHSCKSLRHLVLLATTNHAFGPPFLKLLSFESVLTS